MLTMPSNLDTLIGMVQQARNGIDPEQFKQIASEILDGYKCNTNHAEVIHKFHEATFRPKDYLQFSLIKKNWFMKDNRPEMYMVITDVDRVEWTIQVNEDIHKFSFLSVKDRETINITFSGDFPTPEQREILQAKYSNIISNIEDTFEASWHDIIHREHV